MVMFIQTKQKKSTLPIIMISIVLVSCGQSDREQTSDLQIVNGERVLATDPIVKSTVALVLPSGDQFCTGTIIAPTLVVTAAHCLKDYTETSLYVASGTSPVSSKRAVLTCTRSQDVHREQRLQRTCHESRQSNISTRRHRPS